MPTPPTDEEVMEAARLLVRMGRPTCPADQLDRVAKQVIADPYYTDQVYTSAEQNAVNQVWEAARTVSSRHTSRTTEACYIVVGQRVGQGPDGYGVVEALGTGEGEYGGEAIEATIRLDKPDPWVEDGEDPTIEVLHWYPTEQVAVPKSLGSMFGPPR